MLRVRASPSPLSHAVTLSLFSGLPICQGLYWVPGAVVTVTAQEALLVMSALLVAVMKAVPAATAVTTPFSTVATFVSLLSHATVLSVALSGATVAVSVSVSPTVRVA